LVSPLVMQTGSTYPLSGDGEVDSDGPGRVETLSCQYESIDSIAFDPLTSRRARWWEYRRKGLSLAEIGRLAGVSRQAVHLALSLSDRKMKRAFKELAVA